MSLRSILGGSKVKKRSNTKSRPSPSSSTGSTSSPSSTSWPASAARTKSGKSNQASQKTKKTRDDEDDYFSTDKLDDLGLVTSLATDLSLRDVPQALRHIRETMFDPVPAQASGMGSVRTAHVLSFRAALPPLASAAHVVALLGSPTATEREVVELVRAGAVRRVTVPRRGGVGEMLVEVERLAQLVQDCRALDTDAQAAFLRWLQEAPAEQRLRSGVLPDRAADQLVRAGFLTANVHAPGATEDLFSRPEDRVTLMSLETVARAASGSIGAVGGEGAVHNVGGSGGRGGGGRGEFGELSLAVPGNGALLKLVSAALAHLATLLSKTPYREAAESLLREKWDGGIARDEQQHTAKKARGEFVGILPGRTKKWKEFYGLSFKWILAEAVGAGLVELFATGSVGRGVRLV